MFKNTFYILLFAIISWGSYQLSRPSNTPPDLYFDGVFFENITNHIKKITAGSRAVGDYYHDDVERYLKRELSQMGWQVSTQRSIGFNSKNRTAAPVNNIIATYPGTQPDNKALLLMAHYDAAKFSATGAGDDASGIAVILESVNAMLKTKPAPVNNLIILFTDAEEIGLLGAHAFINEQLVNHHIGLIINLEARGTSGPAMMWPETVGGNRLMIEQFKAAHVPMPVTTSLHYEIYRLLPNDTDLTPFNQQAKINGFNFAFIDNHFNYHTQRDSLDHLSLDTLAHETIQFYSLLNHLAQADINQIQTTDSLVYFSLPMIGLISYSTVITWVIVMVCLLGFFTLLLIALGRKQVTLKSFLTAFTPMLVALGTVYLWCWVVMKLLYLIYPEFNDILQGFPYSGHYIMGAVLLSAGILTSSILSWFQVKNRLPQTFANVLLWLILIIPASYALPGSGLLVWPVLFSILLLAVQIFSPKSTDAFAAALSVASMVLLGSLLINFPIALGIKAIPITAVILAAILSLFAPLFHGKPKVSSTALMSFIPLVLLLWHFHQNPTISKEHPLPTSLSYLYDLDQQTGYYFNYDVVKSAWNPQVFEQANSNLTVEEFRNRYKKPLKQLAQMPEPVSLQAIDIQARTTVNTLAKREVEITLTAHSETEILEIYSKQPLTVHKMSIDNRIAKLPEPMELTTGSRLLHYYFDGKKQIRLKLTLSPEQTIDWQVQTHTTDLLKRPELALKPRPDYQIQKPFIKSDNTIVVQSFAFGFD